MAKEDYKILEKKQRKDLHDAHNNNPVISTLMHEEIIEQINNSISKVSNLQNFKGNSRLRESYIQHWRMQKEHLELVEKFSKILATNFSYKNLKLANLKILPVEQRAFEAHSALRITQNEFLEKFNIQLNLPQAINYSQEYIGEVYNYYNNLFLPTIEPLILIEDYFGLNEDDDLTEEQITQVLDNIISVSKESLIEIEKVGSFEKDSKLFIIVRNQLSQLINSVNNMQSIITACNYHDDYKNNLIEVENFSSRFEDDKLTEEDLKLMNRISDLMHSSLYGSDWEDMLQNFKDSERKIENLLEHFSFSNINIHTEVVNFLEKLKIMSKNILDCQSSNQVFDNAVNTFNKFDLVLDEFDNFLSRHIRN